MQEDTPKEQGNSTALEHPQVYHGSRRNLGLFSFSQPVLIRALLLPGKTHVYMILRHWQARDTPGQSLNHRVYKFFSSSITLATLDFCLHR
jgi:hypothetical protein